MRLGSLSRFTALLVIGVCWSCTADLLATGSDTSSGQGESGGGSSVDHTATPDSTADSSNCDSATLDSAVAPLRRLTNSEFVLSVQDALGSEHVASVTLPLDTAPGFDGLVDNQATTLIHVEAYQDAARELSTAVAAEIAQACVSSDEDCPVAELERIGSQLFRRPLREEERAEIATEYDWGLENLGQIDGLEMVLEVLLQSPHFLYRPELEGEAQAGRLRLSSHELATRLAYFVTGAPPDSILRDKAQSGELLDDATLESETDRLLSTERGQDVYRRFLADWLDLNELDHLERSAPDVSEFSPQMKQETREQFDAFVDVAFASGTAPLASIFSASIPLGGGDSPTGDRVGLLELPFILALHADAAQSSPIKRGKFIREQLFCQHLQPPPADADIVAPDLDPSLSTRERFSQHSEDPSCRGCHLLIDPLGLALEHFDQLGRYRADENGLPIDDSGELVATDVDGTFVGTAELSVRLSESQEVRSCLVTQWYRFALGRHETKEEECFIHELSHSNTMPHGTPRELIHAIVLSHPFRYRTDSP